MKTTNKFLIITALSLIYVKSWAQGVGINTDGSAPDPSALLDVKSTDKGILVPRLNLVNVNNPSPVSSPATGLLVYNTNASVVGGSGTGFYYWNGSQWVRLDISNGDWRLVGNVGTNPANNFLGTTDNVDLVIRTNNNERIRVAAGGNVGIGTNSPQRVLHIERAGDATIRLRDPNDPAGDFWELQSDAFNPNSFGIVRYVGSVAQASSSVVVTSAGNVGLGITTPSERLHVAGNLRLDNAFMPGNNAGASGALLRSNGAGTAPSWLAPGSNGDLLTIAGGAPAWTSPGSLGGNFILNQNSSDQTANFRISGTGRANTSFQAPLYTRADAGTVAIRPFSNSTTAIQLQNASGTSILNVDATNSRVGIGTTSPTRPLQVQATGLQQIAAVNPSTTDNTDPAEIVFDRQAVAATQIAAVGVGGTSRDFFIWVNGLDRVNISETGNVGIGTTTPSERLHVAGNLRLDNAFMPGNNAGVAGALLRSNGAGTAPSWLAPGSNGDILTISSGAPAWSNGNGLFWRLVGNAGTNPTNNFLGTTDNVDLVFRTNNTERVRITAAGNVGIGTATPDRPLTIVNSSEWNIVSRSANATPTHRNHLLLQRSNGGAAVPAGFTLGGIAMGGYDGSNFSFGWNGGAEITAITSQAWTATNRGTHLVFNTTEDNSASAVERMRITSNGNVGIGTASPSYRLDVFGGNGTYMAISGDLPVNGSQGLVGVVWRNTAEGGSYVAYLADPDGGFGVNPRSWELWEYPSSAPGGCCRPRLRIISSHGQNPPGEVVIDAAGLMGIGTPVPTERLHVAGNLRLDNAFMPGNDPGASGALLRSNGAGTAPSWLAPGSNGDLLTIAGGAPAWTSPGSLGGNFILNQNSSDQTANFRISGTGRANTSFQSPVYTRADAGTVAIRPFSNSTTAIQLQNASGTNILNVDATNGRIGVQTAAPITTLDVRGPVWLGTSRIGSTPPAQLNFNSDGSGVEINFMPNVFNKWIDVDAVNFDITTIETPGNTTVMRFAANNTPSSGFLWRTWDGGLGTFTSRMWLRGSDGYLGIGTTSPAHMLDVMGQGRLQTALTITAASATEGGQVNLAGPGDYTATSENCNSWNLDVVNYPSTGRFRIFRGSLGCSTPNPMEVFNILNNGNVGIFSIDPQEQLQIGDRWTFHNGGWKTISYNARYDASANTWRYLVNDEASAINFTSDGQIWFRMAPSGAAGNPISYGNGVMLTNNGNMGIDITGPLARLDVRKTVGHSAGTGSSNDGPTTAIITGGATARFNDWPSGWGGGLSTWDIVCSSIHLNAGGLSYRSDYRFKKSIEDLKPSEILPNFMKLRPVSYYHDTTKIKVDNPEKKIYGFIANEVEKLFPEIVTNAGLPEEVERGMDYTMLIPMLVAVVQKQQAEIENLKRQLSREVNK